MKNYHVHLEGILSQREVLTNLKGLLDSSLSNSIAFISKLNDISERNFENFLALLNTKLITKYLYTSSLDFINTEYILENYVKASLVKLMSGGVEYAEIMVCPGAFVGQENRFLHNKNRNTDLPKVLSSEFEFVSYVCSIVNKFNISNETNFIIRYSLRREKDLYPLSSEEINILHKKIRKICEFDLVCGIDVCGVEYAQDELKNLEKVFSITDKNTSNTLHLGELNLEAQESWKEAIRENIRTALDFEIDRIGHGYFIFAEKSELNAEFLTKMLEEKIRVDLCLTSNYITGVHISKNFSEHPIIQALNAKHWFFDTAEKSKELKALVNVCDDDPCIFATPDSLRQEVELYKSLVS